MMWRTCNRRWWIWSHFNSWRWSVDCRDINISILQNWRQKLYRRSLRMEVMYSSDHMGWMLRICPRSLLEELFLSNTPVCQCLWSRRISNSCYVNLTMCQLNLISKTSKAIAYSHELKIVTDFITRQGWHIRCSRKANIFSNSREQGHLHIVRSLSQ